MDQSTLLAIITDQTRRALWEVKNVIDCVPEEFLSMQIIMRMRLVFFKDEELYLIPELDKIGGGIDIT